MAKAQTRIQLEQLLYAQEHGFDVSPVLIDLVQKLEWERLGIAQVWECACPQKYESEIKVSELWCKAGHPMKLYWTPAQTPFLPTVPESDVHTEGEDPLDFVLHM